MPQQKLSQRRNLASHECRPTPEDHLERQTAGERRIWSMINPVDLGVLLLLGLAIWRLFAVYLPPARSTQTVEVTLELLIRNIPYYVSRSIAPGQDLFQDGTESYLGKICSQTVQPTQLLVAKNGQWVLANDPRNWDLSLKLKRSGQLITDSPRSGIYLGKLAVRIGERLRMHTLYTTVTGEVTALKLRNTEMVKR